MTAGATRQPAAPSSMRLVLTPRGIECWGTNTHLEGYASEVGLDGCCV